MSLFGTFGMQGQRYGAMLAMCGSGLLRPGKVVSRTISLEETSGVLAAMGTYDQRAAWSSSGFSSLRRRSLHPTPERLCYDRTRVAFSRQSRSFRNANRK